MIDGKYYLVEFDSQIGDRGQYNSRVLGLVHGKYAELNCPSMKSLSVSSFDNLEGVLWSGWVSGADNPTLIEVSKDEWAYYQICMEEEEDLEC